MIRGKAVSDSASTHFAAECSQRVVIHPRTAGIAGGHCKIDVESTVQLAGALQRGGMRAIEITLRSAAALDSIRAVSAQVPRLRVAAGTVTNRRARPGPGRGASLVLSPGATTTVTAGCPGARRGFRAGGGHRIRGDAGYGSWL